MLGGGEGVAEGFGNHLVKAQTEQEGPFPPNKKQNLGQNKLWSPRAWQLRRGPGCWQVNSFVVKH